MHVAESALRLLARVVRPQGRHGEVLCESHTDFPEQLTTSDSLTLVGADNLHQPTVVEQVWKPLGRNAGRIVLKLKGVDSISAAELLRGASIHIPESERVAIDDSTYFVSDLVGCDFFDGDRCLGKVVDVQFPTSTSGKQLLDAAALFVVAAESGTELLIPFAIEFTRAINLEDRSIRMELPTGLAQLTTNERRLDG